MNSGTLTHWPRRLAAWILAGALLAGLYAFNSRGVVRGAAPDFHGLLLDGTPVALAQYRGRPLLLQFWATWCPVCGLEQDSIDALARDHAVLSVAMDDATAAQIRAYLDEKGVDYPVLRDPQGRIAARYGVRGVPTSLVIDADGRIRFVEVGYTSEAGLRLRLWWVGR